ncbi:MAG: hypothetical protein M0P01_07655, partial [Treponema sp.]|nr:hypothetical protein [Treponema sp.]
SGFPQLLPNLSMQVILSAPLLLHLIVSAYTGSLIVTGFQYKGFYHKTPLIKKQTGTNITQNKCV